MSDTAEVSDNPKLGAVPVRVVATEEHRQDTIASVFTFVFNGSEAPIQLLPHTARRSRAVIMYALALGGAGSTAFAYLAKRNSIAQADAGITTSSLVLQTQSYGMTSMTYEGSSELWIAPQPTSAPIIVTVLDEWYSEEREADDV